jgi:hypothetical protein
VAVVSGSDAQFDLLPRPKAKGRRFRLVAFTAREHDFQIDCSDMLERILLPSVAWTAIDHAHSLNMALGRNGRPIGYQEMARRKRRRIKAGLPDYLFWHRDRAFAIELKRDADAPLSDDQKMFLRGLIANGCEVAVCWLLDQVAERVRLWDLCRPFTVLT